MKETSFQVPGDLFFGRHFVWNRDKEVSCGRGVCVEGEKKKENTLTRAQERESAESLPTNGFASNKF